MITREKFEEYFGMFGKADKVKPYQSGSIDYRFKTIELLRKRIPHENCKSIIGSASHDLIYLCGVEEVLEFLNEEDLDVLLDCNIGWEEEIDSLIMFV